VMTPRIESWGGSNMQVSLTDLEFGVMEPADAAGVGCSEFSAGLRETLQLHQNSPYLAAQAPEKRKNSVTDLQLVFYGRRMA